MARARNVKPGLFKNELLAEIDPIGRLLFIGLWTLADREGRLEDRPKRIKGELFPYDNCDIDNLLSQLQQHGFLIRYEVNGSKYIQIVNFTKHQNPHVKEPASTIPAPDSHRASPADSLLLIPDSPLPRKNICASRDALEGFERFWRAYPRKLSKGDAKKAWKKIKPNEQLQDRIHLALEQAKTSEDWTKDNGKWVPYPASWLNAERWEDEHKSSRRVSMFDGAI